MSGLDLVLDAFRGWAPAYRGGSRRLALVPHPFRRASTKGVIGLPTVVFLVSLMLLCLFVNTQIIEIEKSTYKAHAWNSPATDGPRNADDRRRRSRHRLLPRGQPLLRRWSSAATRVDLTANRIDHPDRLARLEVEDVTVKDAKSKQVTLADAAGKPLAALIVGKQNSTFDLNGLRGLYVRKPGDPQSWLAEGGVEVPAAAVDLVDRNVVDVPPDTIQRVHFEAAGAPPMNVSKADKAAPDFALEPLPEGRAADPEAVKRLAQAFAAVTLDDVRADKNADKAVKAGTVEAVTFDGLTLKAELLSLDGGTWLRLHADASGSEAAIAEAKTINERTAGWLFKLPQFKAVLLQPRIDDYLKKQDSQS